MVFESGEGISTCVPVVEGYVISHAIQRIDIGGRDVNEYLMDLLKTKVVFPTTFEREFVRDIKEQCCYIRNLGQSGIAIDKKKYCLPDGKTIEMTSEQYEAPELLFNTSMIGRDKDGLQHLITRTLEKCEVDNRKVLASNLILAGGTTMFKGFSDRLIAEYEKISNTGLRLGIVEKPYRRYSSWIGASILASLTSFQPKWITLQEYQEHGVSILHKKSMFQ